MLPEATLSGPEPVELVASFNEAVGAVGIARGAASAQTWERVWLQLPGSEREGPSTISVDPVVLLTHRRGLRRLLDRENALLVAGDESVRRLVKGNIADTAAYRAARTGTAIDDALDLTAPSSGPFRVKRQLRDFQLRDLRKLAGLRHGANFSVPGAGKTTVTYALHGHARNAKRLDKLLVVAPLSAFGAWEEDACEVLTPAPTVARWRGGQPSESVDVLLVNYQKLAKATGHLIAWMMKHDVHLVVDEAHRAKRGAAGEWGRALLALAPLAARRDLLTGTPAPNHPRDLAALLNVLWPGGLTENLIPRQALRNEPPTSAMAQVQKSIAPFYVRTNKKELDLPHPRIRRDVVEMGPLQRQIYDALLNRYAGTLAFDRRDQAAFAQMGEVTMYLLQAACSPRLLSDAIGPRAYRFPPLAIPEGSRLASLIETYADHELPTKFERALRIVSENAQFGLKTLVWSNFPANLLDLEAQLAGLQPALVYGAIPSDDQADDGVRTRERELDRFKHDPNCMVLLANPAAMSEGVSLHHACHDAVYLERSFNAGQYLQSLDRIHRLGLPENVETRITLLVSAGSIDERVDRRLEAKTERLSGMLADPALVRMALPDEEETGGLIDEDADLEELLAELASGLPQLGGGAADQT